MLTRRHFLRGLSGLTLGTTALGSYAFAVEPGLMLDVTRYNIAPATWPADLRLKIAVIADIHACEPWMPAARIREIAEVSNALEPDLTVLLGDFSGGHKFVTGPVMPINGRRRSRFSEPRSACSPSSAITIGGTGPCPA